MDYNKRYKTLKIGETYSYNVNNFYSNLIVGVAFYLGGKPVTEVTGSLSIVGRFDKDSEEEPVGGLDFAFETNKRFDNAYDVVTVMVNELTGADSVKVTLIQNNNAATGGGGGGDGATSIDIYSDDGSVIQVGESTLIGKKLRVKIKASGPKGDTGPAGKDGAKGEQGIKGDSGVKGDTGATGAKGDQGIKGDIGPKGEVGAKGEQGIKGDQGATGKDGATGAKGDVGAKGEQGIQGIKGDQGPQGEKGESGSNTYSKPLILDKNTVSLSFDESLQVVDNKLGVKGSTLAAKQINVEAVLLKGSGNQITTATYQPKSGGGQFQLNGNFVRNNASQDIYLPIAVTENKTLSIKCVATFCNITNALINVTDITSTISALTTTYDQVELKKVSATANIPALAIEEFELFDCKNLVVKTAATGLLINLANFAGSGTSNQIALINSLVFEYEVK